MALAEPEKVKRINEALSDWLIKPEEASLLPKQKWVQVIVLYETQDFGIFRTEGGEELNTEQLSVSDGKVESFPVLLGRKLKAVQRRVGQALIRNVLGEKYTCRFETAEGGVKGLCGECPECFLRGAVVEDKDYNIQSRVYYSAYYAIEPERIITDMITRNAVDDLKKVTGTALTANQVVRPQAHIPAVFSLYSVTGQELVYFLKTVARARRVGSRITEGGFIVPHPIALLGYKYELVSPLKLTLKMYRKFFVEGSESRLSAEKLVKDLRELVSEEKCKKYIGCRAYQGDFLEAAEEMSDEELVKRLYQNEVKRYLDEVGSSKKKGKKQ